MKIPEYKALLKKKPKYRNVKFKAGDIIFASKKESARYCTLKILENAGLISKLELQPCFPFIINEMLVCTYIADFGYIENGVQVIEDIKSASTRKNRAYRIKNKLMKAIFNIEILET